MTNPLKVDDVVSYLAATGWKREPDGWQGASTWQHRGGYEVLVPARDGMGDGDRRIREILRCLSAVEVRATEEIALEISRPRMDKQYFRTFPADHDPGYTSLVSGVQAVHGVRNVLATAARTVLQGPHFAFAGRRPSGVGEVLRAAELGPTRAGSYVVEVRLDMDVATRAPGGDEVGGRAILVQMLEGVSAARVAVLADEPTAFDETVTAGVSADLCKALSDLSGSAHDEAFEINFRWARAQPVEVSAQLLTFPERAGPLLLEAARRLRGLSASGPATVTGVVEGLYDDAAGNDRWRVKIRGELQTEHLQRPRRAVWVRLGDPATYDRAITAHREGRMITVAGELSSTTGRVELVPDWRLEL
jgi:hypothetical protein